MGISSPLFTWDYFSLIYSLGDIPIFSAKTRLKVLTEEKPLARAISVMFAPFSKREQACSTRRVLTKSVKLTCSLSLKICEI